MFGNLHYIDLAIVLAYFAVVLWIAWYVSRGGGRKSQDKDSKDYFLAGKSAGWFVIGASLFASNIGSEIIIGVSGAGARAEMAQANFEILAALILILLGCVFVPFYLRSGVYTMPEFLEIRYSKACRNYLSVISILAYVITKISLIIFAGALVFETMGISFWTGAIITIVATGFYTILGGLRAVIYTDMLQTFVLLAGTGAVTYFGLNQLGGWDGMMLTLQEASNTLATRSPMSSSTSGVLMTTPPIRGRACCSELPFWGFGTGAPISSSCKGPCRPKT
jgi:SSS family solute:Na+ symporter